MKVADIINTHIISITEDTPVKEGARLIFSLGIGAIPVVKGKQLVGILTGHDILSKMYPTMQELFEDFAHAKKFEQMETNITYLLDTPVRKLMNQKVIVVTPHTPLMQAQSLMLLKQFSHLPIVNEQKEVVGIISQGDIFRALLKKEIPRLEKERYADFVSIHYDRMVNWKKRFRDEYPALSQLFKKERVQKILDLGTWTGEYTIRLAKKGNYRIVGLDHNALMIKISEEKRKNLSRSLQKRVSFMLSKFNKLSKTPQTPFDAVLCMGNSLPYIPVSLEKLFKEVFSALKDIRGVFIIQMLNFEKILTAQNRLLSFNIQKSRTRNIKEHLAIEFFDQKKGGRQLMHHVIIFHSDGKNWIYKGITSIPVGYITKENIETAAKKAGFREIVFAGNAGKYQGDYGKLSFEELFDPAGSDWLNVLAKK